MAEAANTGTEVQCFICKKSIPKREAERQHIVPRALGGTRDPKNLVWMCKGHNHMLSRSLNIAAVLASATGDVGGTATTFWLKAFKVAPSITAIGTIAALLATLIVTFYADKDQSRPPAPFSEQVRSLDQTEDSLRRLSGFIEGQKRRIGAEEQALTKLHSEETRLQPLVQADRRTVDALLREQEIRAATSAQRERIIAFVLGVFASIVAAIAFSAAGKMLRYLSRKMGRGNPPIA